MRKLLLILLIVPMTIGSLPVAAQDSAPQAYMTFAVNTHDWRNPEESAAIILKLITLFEANGIRGDFYLTAPITKLYAEQFPDVLERLCNSDMTISYHVRPPHPLNAGFDKRLRDLEGQALYDAIYASETQGLDLATGELIADEVGGYLYVAQACGRLPVALGIPNGDQKIREAAMQVYTDLGARMIIQEHETNAALRQIGDLWTRPSDFSVTRWTAGDESEEQFWWNMLGTPHAAAYDPVAYLETQLGAWSEEYPVYVTALIHEDNFYHGGASIWENVFYSYDGRAHPYRPPYVLDAPDAGFIRSPENQVLIWDAYSALVAYAATNPTIQVVTSEDILNMVGR